MFQHFVDGKPTEENPDPLPAADGSHPKTRKLPGRHDLPNSLTAPKRRNCSKGYTDQASVVNQVKGVHCRFAYKENLKPIMITSKRRGGSVAL